LLALAAHVFPFSLLFFFSYNFLLITSAVLAKSPARFFLSQLDSRRIITALCRLCPLCQSFTCPLAPRFFSFTIPSPLSLIGGSTVAKLRFPSMHLVTRHPFYPVVRSTYSTLGPPRRFSGTYFSFFLSLTGLAQSRNLVPWAKLDGIMARDLRPPLSLLYSDFLVTSPIHLAGSVCPLVLRSWDRAFTTLWVCPPPPVRPRCARTSIASLEF